MDFSLSRCLFRAVCPWHPTTTLHRQCLPRDLNQQSMKTAGNPHGRCRIIYDVQSVSPDGSGPPGTSVLPCILPAIVDPQLSSTPHPSRTHHCQCHAAVSQLLLNWKGGNSSLKREPLGRGLKLNNATWIKLTKVYLVTFALIGANYRGIAQYMYVDSPSGGGWKVCGYDFILFMCIV